MIRPRCGFLDRPIAMSLAGRARWRRSGRWAAGTHSGQQERPELAEHIRGGASSGMISGTSPDGSKAVTVLLFAEGKTFTVLEFDSAPKIPCRRSSSPTSAKSRDAAIKSGLPGCRTAGNPIRDLRHSPIPASAPPRGIDRVCRTRLNGMSAVRPIRNERRLSNSSRGKEV